MTQRRYAFAQLDVFTDRAFGGNQLAVFTDARGLTTAEMQTLTREMNFSESTFVFPAETPETAARVRIFTPAIEMPMAGHPTVGTAWWLAQSGALTGASAQLGLNIGPIKIDLERDSDGKLTFVWMTHRLPEFGPVRHDRDAVAGALGLAAADLRPDLPLQEVSTGVPFLFVPIVSLEALGRARINQSALAGLWPNGEPRMVYLFTAHSDGLRARMFAPHVADIPEDPATGAAAGPMAAYAVHHGLKPDGGFVIDQGVEMGRPSRIHVSARRSGDAFVEVKIGGQAVVVGMGQIFW
ncbi:MAG TPA: PhzF family phenazine biosynthesis protein [Anaerolineales bacterium]|nr:PhzF family phenazine biosynthesis protein [Anaerolineales bacterium]HRF48549.1 PhzF family phenazine biosynthesis protein [Anaerolineales bacterium]